MTGDHWLLVGNGVMLPVEFCVMTSIAPATGFLLMIASLLMVASIIGDLRS